VRVDANADILSVCCNRATERKELAELAQHALRKWEKIV